MFKLLVIRIATWDYNGGMLSLMVSIVGNGKCEPSSNPELGRLYFTFLSCSWERPESICSSFSNGKMVGHSGFVSLSKATSQGEEIQKRINLKIELCHILPIAEVEKYLSSVRWSHIID